MAKGKISIWLPILQFALAAMLIVGGCNVFFGNIWTKLTSSDELIVAARIPAITKPANIGGKKLVERVINIFSAVVFVRSALPIISGLFIKRTLPTIPINTATASEITTQIIAILLDILILILFLLP